MCRPSGAGLLPFSPDSVQAPLGSATASVRLCHRTRRANASDVMVDRGADVESDRGARRPSQRRRTWQFCTAVPELPQSVRPASGIWTPWLKQPAEGGSRRRPAPAPSVPRAAHDSPPLEYQPLCPSTANSFDRVAGCRVTAGAWAPCCGPRPDGSNLDMFAWGLRNPYGLEVGTDGALYATMHGFDARRWALTGHAPRVRPTSICAGHASHRRGDHHRRGGTRAVPRLPGETVRRAGVENRSDSVGVWENRCASMATPPIAPNGDADAGRGNAGA